MKNKLEKIGQNSFMDNFVKTDDILNDMCGIIESSQKAAYQAVNIALVQRNWLLGYRIASEELQGNERAEYGTELIKKLSKELGCQVVEISALKGKGIKEAADRAVTLANSKRINAPIHKFDSAVEEKLDQIEAMLPSDIAVEQRRFYAIKLFERDDKISGLMSSVPNVETIIDQSEKELDDDAESIITNERYQFITSIIDDCYKKHSHDQLSVSDKIDRIVTNRWLALPIFAVVMFVVYYISVTTVGTWATDWANEGVFGDGWSLFGLAVPSIPSLIEGLLESLGTAAWLNGLILDGIVAGVGAVLGFVPQMLVLFFFLAVLESCGYMARVAFIMDKNF